MKTLLVFTFTLSCLFSTSAQAHFIWLLPQENGDQQTVQAYFGEDASPDDPELLSYLKGMQAWRVSGTAKPVELEMKRSDDELSASMSEDDAQDSLILAKHDLGVMDRGDATFRLMYYAKTGPALGDAAWKSVKCAKHLRLDVTPVQNGDKVVLTIKFDGKPAANVEVTASGPGLDHFEGTANAKGHIAMKLPEAGVYSIRAKHVETADGEVDGKKYAEVRHYSTLTLQKTQEAQSGSTPVAGNILQSLPQPVTSFGGAVLDNSVYVYGGHSGGAHSYSQKEQGRVLHRLDLGTGKWEELAKGPYLQGLALVPHGGKLYRIGGFTAKNAEGEEHDLWSQTSVACYDPSTNMWSDMPALPEPRSSFDAAVLGDTIYVFGGWKMAGEADSVWHEHGLSLDLSAEKPEWKTIKQPFQRRALAVAAFEGKIYCIGGMQSEDGITTNTQIYDPQTETWNDGPSLVKAKIEEKDEDDESGPPRGLTGFGASAFATGGRLFVTTYDGDLQQLSKDGKSWKVKAQTPTARFFHRMLPISNHQLVMVGGASMSTGKFEEVEVITVQ